MKKHFLLLGLCLMVFPSFAQPFLYTTFSVDSLRHHDLEDISDMANGDLWVILAGDLFHRDAETGNLTYHLVDSANSSLKLRRVEILNGQVWVLTDDYTAYFLVDGEWKKAGINIGLPSDEVRDFVVDHKGDVWLAGPKAISRFNGDTLINYHPFNLSALQLAVAGQRLYLNARDSIVYFENGMWHGVPSPPLYVIRNMVADETGNLYCEGSAPDSVYFFNGIKWTALPANHRILAVQGENMYALGTGYEPTLYRYTAGQVDSILSFNRMDLEKAKASGDGNLWLIYDWQIGPFAIKLVTDFKSSFARVSTGKLVAGVSSGGSLFRDIGFSGSNGTCGNFTYRDQDTASFMQVANLWIKGKLDGEERVSAQTTDSWGEGDFVSGPVSESYDLEYIERYSRVWRVSREEIQKHLNRLYSRGYQMPDAIRYWPAHGRTDKGEAEYLAPFVDYNANGIYEPEMGDHPRIKGDEAVYFMVNDDRSANQETRSPGLGLEVHGMLYSYRNDNEDVQNSIFLSYRIINRSGAEVKDLKTGLWAIFKEGWDVTQRLTGCDSTLGLVYSYSAANEDTGSGGFGTAPPAGGFIPLSENLTGSISFNYDRGPFCYSCRPDWYDEYIQYMDLRWLDSSRVYIESPAGILGQNGDGYVGSNSGSYSATNFQYNDQVNWYQGPWGSNDLRNLGVFEPHDLKDDESFCLDLSFTTARGSDHLASLYKLKERARRLKEFYRDQEGGCPQQVSDFEGEAGSSISIYPNPARNNLRVLVPANASLMSSVIYNVSGQVVARYGRECLLDIAELPTGMYILQCSTGRKVYGFKFLKR